MKMEQLTMHQNSEVLQTLIRRFWIIILGLIVGGALGALVSQLMTPIYQSTVYLLVVPASDDSGTSPSGDVEQRLRGDYAQAFSRLATEPSVVGEAVRESGVGIDPEDIERYLNVSVSPNGPILEVIANFQDPEAAATLADVLGSALSSFTEERAEGTGYRAEVMAEAAPAAAPAAPGWRLNIAVGAAAGLLVGGIIALLWDDLRQAGRIKVRRVEKEDQREKNQRPARQEEKDGQRLMHRLQSLLAIRKVWAYVVAIFVFVFAVGIGLGTMAPVVDELSATVLAPPGGAGLQQVNNQEDLDEAASNVNTLSPSESVFVHRATIENISGNSTYVDHPLTNGNPDAILLVTPNWSPEGTISVYNDHSIGVWYDPNAQRWAVFNQDLAAMPEGTAFNVGLREQGEGSRDSTGNSPLEKTDES